MKRARNVGVTLNDGRASIGDVQAPSETTAGKPISAKSLIGGKCQKCGHVWIVSRLPIEMSVMAREAKQRGKECPMCRAPDPLMAKTEELRVAFGLAA